MRFGHALRSEWPLDPAITYLNHGTVGVTPKKVLVTQQAIRDEMERQPARFMLREVTHSVGAPSEGPTRIRLAAEEVAGFIGARGRDLVFVNNATTGANIVLRSFPLEADDEVLVTDHSYGAVGYAARYVADRRRAVVRTVELPYPDFDPARAIAAIDAAIGPKTRLLLIDHIASNSAVVMPVAAIAARCHERGVAVLVDGAHAPGAIPLDVPSLGVDWYTGNLHKWAQAPRSCGFLWVAEARQAKIRPLVVSWGIGQGFTAEFDMPGTRDPSAWLAAPAGLRFLQNLDFERVLAWNHDLAREAGRLLASRWGTRVGVPEASIGPMVSVPAPPRFAADTETVARLRDALLFVHGFEVHVCAAFGRTWVRVSAQVYNELSDIDRLASAVLSL